MTNFNMKALVAALIAANANVACASERTSFPDSGDGQGTPPVVASVVSASGAFEGDDSAEAFPVAASDDRHSLVLSLLQPGDSVQGTVSRAQTPLHRSDAFRGLDRLLSGDECSGSSCVVPHLSPSLSMVSSVTTFTDARGVINFSSRGNITGNIIPLGHLNLTGTGAGSSAGRISLADGPPPKLSLGDFQLTTLPQREINLTASGFGMLLVEPLAIQYLVLEGCSFGGITRLHRLLNGEMILSGKLAFSAPYLGPLLLEDMPTSSRVEEVTGSDSDSE